MTLPEGGVDDRSVERVRDDPDQGPCGAPRESRVGVQGEDVAHRREDRQVPDLDGKAGVGRGTQQAVELLDLPPLALPAHEDAFLRVPLPIAVEQVEAVVPIAHVPAVERLDAGHRRGQDLVVTGHRERPRVLEVGEDREVDFGVEVAERLHLQVRQEPLDVPDAAQEHGHDHHRAGALGDPFAEIEAGEPARRHERGHDALDDEQSEFARGEQREHRRGRRHPGGARGACVRVGTENAEAGQEADAAEVRRGRMGEGPTAESFDEVRAVRHVDLEAAPARADQVMADVRLPVADPLQLRGPAGARDGAQGHAHLRLAGRLGEFLHGVPVAVAAGEVHPWVDPGRVPPQDLLHRADQLHEAAPVERRTEPEARHRVAGGDLIGRVALVLGADRILGRRPSRGKRLLHRGGEGGHAGVVLAHPLPELRHEGARKRVGQRAGSITALQAREGGVRLQARRPPGKDSVGQKPQVLEERELEHAGPRPQFADRQRRHGLKREDEPREALRVEPSVAVPDQLERHRMDAGLARELACRELRAASGSTGPGGRAARRAPPTRRGESCRAATRPPGERRRLGGRRRRGSGTPRSGRGCFLPAAAAHCARRYATQAPR